MRLMYTTSLASALLLAGPALAAGDKVEGTTGMSAPEASAAELPGGSADVRKGFESAGFEAMREAPDAYVLRMQSPTGEPIWVVLTPERLQQVGAADQGTERGARELLPQGGVPGQNLAGAPAIPGPQDPQQGDSQLLPSGPPATEVPQEGRELGTAQSEYEKAGEQANIGGVPEIPGQPEEPRGRDVAEAPDTGQEGTAGQTEPQGFAAEIPAQLQSDLEGAGFKQVESVDGANIFHAKTKDGQSAFIIIGDLGEGQQQ